MRNVGFTALVPKYQFAGTLEEQPREFRDNLFLRRMLATGKNKESGIADTSYWGRELEFFIFGSARFNQTPNSGFTSSSLRMASGSLGQVLGATQADHKFLLCGDVYGRCH